MVHSCAHFLMYGLVPVFDAADIFQGDHPDVHFDFTNMGEVCDYRGGFDIPEKSIVGIIHSIVRGPVKTEMVMQFGVYAIVILAIPDEFTAKD